MSLQATDATLILMDKGGNIIKEEDIKVYYYQYLYYYLYVYAI